MRLSILTLAAAITLGAPLVAEAAPAAAQPGTTVQSDNFQDVAGRCGRRSHWVRGHKTRHHGYVKGHCERNR